MLTVLVSFPGQEYHVLTPKTVLRGNGPVSCPHCQPVRTQDPGGDGTGEAARTVRLQLPALGGRQGAVGPDVDCAGLSGGSRHREANRIFSGLLSPCRVSCPHVSLDAGPGATLLHADMEKPGT